MAFVLFPIAPSFGASGRVCFKIVTFPGYLHILFQETADKNVQFREIVLFCHVILFNIYLLAWEG